MTMRLLPLNDLVRYLQISTASFSRIGDQCPGMLSPTRGFVNIGFNWNSNAIACRTMSKWVKLGVYHAARITYLRNCFSDRLHARGEE